MRVSSQYVIPVEAHNSLCTKNTPRGFRPGGDFFSQALTITPVRWRTDRKKRTRYPCGLPRGSWTGWRTQICLIFAKARHEHYPAPHSHRLADRGYSDSCHATSAVDHRGDLSDHGRAGGTVWQRELFALIRASQGNGDEFKPNRPPAVV